jgi:hypothetical protein
MVHAGWPCNADDVVVSVGKHDCGHAAALGDHRIIHPGRPTEAVTIDKPLEQLARSDPSGERAPMIAQAVLSELRPKPK